MLRSRSPFVKSMIFAEHAISTRKERKYLRLIFDETIRSFADRKSTNVDHDLSIVSPINIKPIFHCDIDKQM